MVSFRLGRGRGARFASMSARRHVAVVGGGAAGFFAAITCAEANPAVSVTLFEATAHLLAKVRVSGGGRCNVTHACFDPRELVKRYPRGGRELLGPLHRWQPRDMIEWFAARGVKLKTEDDGRMFPVTDDSATIVNCLLAAAKNAGVVVRTQCGVVRVEKQSATAESAGLRATAAGPAVPPYRLTLTTGETVATDCLLIATGGNRASAGFAIAERFGHAIEPLVPSLFTFHIADPRLEGLAGVSVEDAATAVVGTRLRERGPLLVTHWGLSGPAILKLSAWGARELAACEYRFQLRVNFVAANDAAALRRRLTEAREKNPRKQIGTWSPLPLPIRLWERLLAAVKIPADRTWNGVSNDALGALATGIESAEFSVAGKSMNKEEFVTCGGVRLRDVDFKTMESRLCPGLYFAGEVLDIDGVTGGFNFQAAWTTAWIAGTAIAAAAVRAAPHGGAER